MFVSFGEECENIEGQSIWSVAYLKCSSFKMSAIRKEKLGAPPEDVLYSATTPLILASVPLFFLFELVYSLIVCT